jgi:hypothetical protein
MLVKKVKYNPISNEKLVTGTKKISNFSYQRWRQIQSQQIWHNV